MKKKDARSQDQATQATIRQKAVRAIINGATQVEAAKTFEVTRQAVGKWWAAYKQGGFPAIEKKSRRPKSVDSNSGLLGWQCASIVRTIKAKTPDQLMFPFMLWTRESVADLIEKRFGIKLSRWTVGRLLKKLGMSPQKPVKRAYEQQPERVKHWLETEYPKISRRATKERAEIHWGDEMGVRSDDQAGRAYGKIGQTPVVRVAGIRFSCNMISTVTNRGSLRFMVFDGKFSADVLLKFLKRLLRTVKRKIFLILDGHPVHKSKKVDHWLANNVKKIEMFLLPAYSPELNPDELLNQDVKTNAIRKKRAANKTGLKKNLTGYLRKRQKQPKVVMSYFCNKNVRYAA
ncbi:MAG: transposase [Bdellovibrionales bacterium RIFOXYD12_FULL_39_22]|nr:MAG: transposase [Bdellovibrionales bacterium RIFOXYB1_FULL_39_21]OFZ40774.1 MAG: transposase [Bdellovibrionales bacterium RIFOXYC12_FULL_39_17]OFZ48196.1 MAG: transposase [Bdellovibrionales bacterium RIFOXYC1_FULL_39_130]OFZ75846.1 MAG: transposase [Bdellovibrionales bacterium RIFOXYD1_FULL_39_84]OFZ91907.1 MAG: transposase [Bdellovibrionales bacterium RIFOXYD12_FULL_39_22]HLE11417.1 IS630 family transposase [Bacteriovoracaceae bacterium]